MASTSQPDPQNEALKLLKKEKDAIDRQIADLQARSRQYGSVIAGLEAPPTFQSEPAVIVRNEVYTPGASQEEMSGVAKVFAFAAKDNTPAELLPSAQDILREFQTNKHAAANTFVVPNDAFNRNNSPVVEATVIRSYDDEEEPAGKDLVELRRVLAGLAAREYGGNRDHIWPRGFQQFLNNPKQYDTPDVREAVRTVEGASSIGLNIAVLRVNAGTGGDDKPGFVYVIDDTDRKKMFAMGPAPIGAPLRKTLEDNGVTYFEQSDANAATQANEFLAQGARWRGERGLLVPGHTQNVIESMIKACSIMFEIGPSTGSGVMVAKGETVGAVLKRAANPAIYTNIVKPGA